MTRLVTAALAAVVLSSCGPAGPPRKTTYPVKGKLLYKSQPAAGAIVSLHPQGGNPDEWPTGYPQGEVQADGSFEIQTYEEKDGAPPGDYAVVIIWPQPPGDPDEEAGTVDRLGGQYASAARSKIQAKVNEGPTELPPIELK